MYKNDEKIILTYFRGVILGEDSIVGKEKFLKSSQRILKKEITYKEAMFHAFELTNRHIYY